MRLGLLRNPASTGNRGRPAPALPPGAVMAETARDGGAGGALVRLREAGAQAIVIDGGDGTLAAALTAFSAAFGSAWPPVAILAHGNTNLVARRLGAIVPADLHRLAEIAPGRAAMRAAPVLWIDAAGGGAPRRGFIAGWGAYAAATRIAAEEIAARHDRQVAGAMLATLRRSLWGTEGAALRAGIARRISPEGGAEIAPEGGAEIAGQGFLGIVTVLPGRLLGPLAPFWGEGGGALRWLDIAAPPRRLALAAPLVALGRPMRWMERAGYRSGRARRIALSLDGPMILDGEPIPPDPGGGWTLSADECVRVLRL